MEGKVRIPSRQELIKLRALEGKRVELVKTTDQRTHLKPGATGTVQWVDDVGTVHIRWDDGGDLGLLHGLDQWKVIEG